MMPPVAVRILHPGPHDASGPLSRWVEAARGRLAEHHRRGFLAAGADDVAIVSGPPDGPSFGGRLRALLTGPGRAAPGGLVVLGSGSIPLATSGDRRAFVAGAGGDGRRALANNRYSADIVAISRTDTLPAIPELPGDNALPRWLEEVAGYRVQRPARALAPRIRHRWAARSRPARRGLGRGRCLPADVTVVETRLAAVRAAVTDRRAELLVSGRTSAATLAWLERHAAARTRAWIEERGLRAASRLAQATDAVAAPGRPGRPPGSLLGTLLDRDGPGSLGDHLARFADAAIVDTRVLLAHRLGADEAGWPVGGGPVRLRPAPPGSDRRPVAARAHGVGRGRADPGPARRPHAGRAGRPARRRRAAGGRSMDVTPGLRRDPAPDLDAVGQDDELVARIQDAIGRAGPMTFARFMDLALYDPDGGYYRAAAARPGRDGDFLTAPEAHPIFGAALARAVIDTWDRLGRPDPFVLREYGAGTGVLATAILDAIRIERPELRAAIRYQPIEVESRRLEAIAARLAAAGHGDALVTPVEIRDRPIEGMIVANEVLDALPTHRVVVLDAVLREVMVGSQGGVFVDVEADPSTPALAARLAADGVALADGQRAEICLALDPWVAQAAAGLERGLLLLIDYGYPAAELYDPVRRRDGTLRAYLRHRVGDDPYRHVGRQDLTAHVDVTAVERAALAAGLVHLGTTTQAEFLVGLGTEGLLRAIQADPATTLEDYLLVRSALMRLLDPTAMGRFRVMGFGRDWPDGPPLAGFDYHLQR